MNKITHFLYIPLADVGITQIHRNDEWLRYRIDIFKKYTLQFSKPNRKELCSMDFRPSRRIQQPQHYRTRSTHKINRSYGNNDF